MKTKFDFFCKAALVLTFAVAAATACRKDEVPVYPGTDITPSDTLTEIMPFSHGDLH